MEDPVEENEVEVYTGMYEDVGRKIIPDAFKATTLRVNSLKAELSKHITRN